MQFQFRWEVFNVTNSVRFDPHNVNVNLDNPSSFGLAGSNAHRQGVSCNSQASRVLVRKLEQKQAREEPSQFTLGSGAEITADCARRKCQCFILTASHREVAARLYWPNQSVMLT
jgi:hypothetical protein